MSPTRDGRRGLLEYSSAQQLPPIPAVYTDTIKPAQWVEMSPARRDSFVTSAPNTVRKVHELDTEALFLQRKPEDEGFIVHLVNSPNDVRSVRDKAFLERRRYFRPLGQLDGDNVGVRLGQYGARVVRAPGRTSAAGGRQPGRYIPPENGSQRRDPSHGILHAHVLLRVAGHAAREQRCAGMFRQGDQRLNQRPRQRGRLPRAMGPGVFVAFGGAAVAFPGPVTPHIAGLSPA